MISTSNSPAHSYHFLVVEPDPLFRLLLCVALSGQVSGFHAVPSYGEARALLGARHFTAIIAEQHLPGGTATELYEEVRRTAPSVPFILMCGGDRVDFVDSQFRFFSKPFRLLELADTLASMIAAEPAA